MNERNEPLGSLAAGMQNRVSAKLGDIWWAFMLLAVSAYANATSIPFIGLLAIALQAYLSWFVLRWAIVNISSGGRQLPLTFADHVPFRAPVNACKSRPGNAISLGFIETFSRPRIKRKRSACLAWIPDLIPLVKSFSNPLCLKRRITR